MSIIIAQRRSHGHHHGGDRESSEEASGEAENDAALGIPTSSLVFNVLNVMK